eukprot:s341_g8.t1
MWALPDLICQLQIAVSTAGPQLRAPDLTGQLPDLSRECPIAVGTAGPQLRVPDRSGHCRTSTGSARLQWALSDLNREHGIPVGIAGPQPPASALSPTKCSGSSVVS